MAQIDARIPLMVQAPQIEPYQNALARNLRNRQMQADADLQQQKISDTNALRQAAMGGKLFTPDGMLAPNALDVVGRMAPGSLPQFAQLAATQQQTMRKNRIQDAEFNMKRQEWLKTGLSSVKSPQEALAYIQSGVQSGLVDPTEAQQWSAQVPQDPGQFNTWITGLNRQLMTPQQRYAADNPGGQVVDTPSGVQIVNPRTGESRPAIGANGKPVMGDKATAAQEKARKRQIEVTQAQAAIENSATNLDRLAAAATAIKDSPALGRVTGAVGMLPSIPGGAAADTEAQLETLKSQIAFSVLQAMRDASKTGGALGSVSEKELSLLQNNLAALDTKQSPEAMKKSLQQIIDYTAVVKQRMQQAYQQQYGDQGSAGSEPAEAPARRPSLTDIFGG